MTTRLTIQALPPVRLDARNALGAIQLYDPHRIHVSRDGMDSIVDGHALVGYGPDRQLQSVLDLLDRRPTLKQPALEFQAPSVMATIQDALLLLKARGTGQMLAGVLGETTPSNVRGSRIVYSVEDAADAVRQGYRTLKLKAGCDTPANDADLVACIRAQHPEVVLRVDANGSWNLSQAVDFCARAASSRLQYLEEPLPQGPDNLSSWHALSQRTDIPLATDSYDDDWWQRTSGWTPHFAVIKPRLGGLARARKRAARLLRAGVMPVFSHMFEQTHGQAMLAHLSASLPRPVIDGIALPAAGCHTADPLPELPAIQAANTWIWELQ